MAWTARNHGCGTAISTAHADHGVRPGRPGAARAGLVPPPPR